MAMSANGHLPPQKPSPPTPIVDRFRSLLKQRAVLAGRYSGDDDYGLGLAEDVVELYELMLSELTFNSKPIITELTIIAGEQREYGEGIADAICARIIEAPVDQKLPSLYLVDSIVKNIGSDYDRYFSSRLPEVFCEAYRQVDPSLQPSMRHLFGTWNKVFPHSVLRKIATQLRFSLPVNNQSPGLTSLRTSESPRPTHGIHVNPKYLHQLEHSISENVGAQRLKNAAAAAPSSFPHGTNKIFHTLNSRIPRPLSPTAERPLSSEVDGFWSMNSPRSLVHGVSSSHSGLDYGLGITGDGDEDADEWTRKRYLEDRETRGETCSIPRINNGHEHLDPRALIDAYGDDRVKRNVNIDHGQLDRQIVNGNNKMAPRSWQHTEEDEFDWEDINPTSSNHNRSSSFLLSSGPPMGTVRAMPGIGKTASSAPSESNFRGSLIHQMQSQGKVNSSSIAEDVYPANVQRNQITGSRDPRQAFNLPQHLSQSTHVLHDREAEGQVIRHSSSSIIGSAGDVNTSGTWSDDVHKSYFSVQQTYPLHRQSRSQFDRMNTGSSAADSEIQTFGSFHGQQLNSMGGRGLPLIQQNHGKLSHFLPQLRAPQEVRENFPQSSIASRLTVTHPLSHGYPMQRPGGNINMGTLNSVHPGRPSLSVNNLHSQMGLRPPLPVGPRPMMLNNPQNSGSTIPNQPAGGAFSGLINTLMAQGFISMANQPPIQESLGLDFDADLLKVRHDSAITALYSDLPRQCKTCGLRFKCQEEHSSHMDWHVNRNRSSKSRKQKPSRKWFVSASMWLTGAEALGTDSVASFLTSETVVEKKEEEELAVPADEDQNACALCGERFDDFFSDETEEWMYKGAVYLNAPYGSIAGMDRSQLGPIVHAKCMSESNAAPPGDIRQIEGANIEEGSQRKRLRS